MDDKWNEVVETFKATARAASDFLTKGFEKAGQRTGEAVETARYNIRIKELNAEITALYKDIGRLVYEGGENPYAPNEKINEKLRQISAKKAEIEELRARAEDVKGTRKCPGCGKTCEKSYSFCAVCGTKL